MRAGSSRERGVPVEFWFDFASTYSYVAAMRIEDLCRDAGVALVWRPFTLGPLFARQGWNDSPFNLNPLRGNYMWRDVERLAAKFGLPWRRPSRFPRLATLPLRVACSIADEAWCGAFVRRVFVANFGEDREIGEREVVAALLAELGHSPEAVLEAALDRAARSAAGEHRTGDRARHLRCARPRAASAGDRYRSRRPAARGHERCVRHGHTENPEGVR